MPNLTFNTITDTKKPLSNCVEKYCQNQNATSTKSYTIYDNDGTFISLKLKGISKDGKHLVSGDYNKVIAESTVIKGSSTTLQMHDHVMSKVTTLKKAITGLTTKLSHYPIMPAYHTSMGSQLTTYSSKVIRCF